MTAWTSIIFVEYSVSNPYLTLSTSTMWCKRCSPVIWFFSI